ncbi:sulfite exporter TauE/SafE family protein [Desnuesiella massiliensis]|uniref:urease accessory protein UreH domain-containing protein n=1 Tax=Desnuesiella massiliensis TaxID=1650662 RepID=UPI0006E1E850|nr:sulfite exporter TauE/SafE family protein [Desnuesiella massiliensis]
MSVRKVNVKVYDMTCNSCEKKVENEIKKNKGVINAMASHKESKVLVEYEDDSCSLDQIKNSIKKSGYSLNDSKEFKFLGILIIALAIIMLSRITQGFDMESKLSGAGYIMLFIIGALTSIHCVGMCGGIMLSQSLSYKGENKFQAMIPALQYNIGRIVSYTILGGLIGALGSVFSLSIFTKGIIQLVAGIFMVIMGLNLYGFKFFKSISIKLPWSSCSMKKNSKAPFVVGLLNGLMPCGPLQTMQLYALGTGSALKGALSMFLFSLGTVPLMLTFGAISGLLAKGYTKKILKFSGILVIILGIIMSNRGFALFGINLNPMVAMASLKSNNSLSSNKSPSGYKATLQDGVQIVNMTADNRGYTPNVIYVKKNTPVKWVIDGKQLNSCNNAIVVPALNKQQKLKSGENIIEFTPKDQDINFSCWMGMIRGVIKVVDNLDTVDTSKSEDIPPSQGGSCCSTGGSMFSPAPENDKKSIYGDDITKAPTEKLVKLAKIDKDGQSISIKGQGYEFDPIVTVLNKGLNTKLTIDLRNFDNVEGTYYLFDIDSSKNILSFKGKKDIINLNFTRDITSTLGIIKDGQLLGILEVVDDLNKVNLDDVRRKFIY